MIRKLLFLSQILNARELGSKNDLSDARFDGLFQKTLAFEEIELTEDDLIWAEKTYGYGDGTGAFYSPQNIPEEFFLLGDKLCRYGSDDDKNADTEELIDKNIIEADSSEEVARAIAASVLR